MSFPSYPDYRDSGVQWIGEVPTHWRVVRLGALFREIVEAGSDELPVLSVSIHSGVSDGELSPAEMDRNVTRSDDRTKYKRVQPNDLVYNMMRAWQGGFGAVQTTGMVSPAYVVARPTGDQSSKFVERVLRTPNAVDEIRRYSKGVTDFRLRLYWDEFKSIRIALPPKGEETAINAFLDRETAKIDALVEAQQRLIELLNEKRRAIISLTVTKGLDPTVSMKDSGIEWLGHVPAHWRVLQLKYVISILSGYAFASQNFTEDSEQSVRLLRGVNVAPGFIRWDDAVYWNINGSDKLSGFNLIAGDVVIGMDRPWIAGGLRIACVSESDVPSLLLQRVAALRGSGEIDHSLISYNLSTDSFYHYCVPDMTGVSVPHISPEQISSFHIALPPRLEQKTIVDKINGLCNKYNLIVAAAESAIKLLQERRAALISAAVTGKIDVRDASTRNAEAA